MEPELDPQWAHLGDRERWWWHMSMGTTGSSRGVPEDEGFVCPVKEDTRKEQGRRQAGMRGGHDFQGRWSLGGVQAEATSRDTQAAP